MRHNIGGKHRIRTCKPHFCDGGLATRCCTIEPAFQGETNWRKLWDLDPGKDCSSPADFQDRCNKPDSAKLPSNTKIGQGGRIRTCGILVPGQALYQTELHPEGAGGTPPKTFLPRVSGSAEVWAGLALVTPFAHGNLKRLAGETGFEPVTHWLTASRSAAELHPMMPCSRIKPARRAATSAPRSGNMVRLRGCKSKNRRRLTSRNKGAMLDLVSHPVAMRNQPMNFSRDRTGAVLREYSG